MTRHNPVTTAYVFAASPASKPTLAGEFQHGRRQTAAEEIIQQVSQPLLSWREHYLSCGVNEQDVQLIAKRIEA